MAIGDIEKARIGSTLAWDGRGMLYEKLSALIKRFDPDPWVREKWDGRLWHLSEIVGRKHNGDWWVDEITGDGDRLIELSKLEGRFTVINWLDRAVTEDECMAWREKYTGYHYDHAGYIWCAFNRLSRCEFPVVTDRTHYCWERNASFNRDMGKPIYYEWEMPYMPILLKRYYAEQSSLVGGKNANRSSLKQFQS
ncbi:hypothetical protein [Dehalococcoides sp. THU4]|uniref:hypothetical protein n=1 Tax=Dehalococcoides sp. THU4 TaxID=3348344 RepID=UPI00371E2E84